MRYGLPSRGGRGYAICDRSGLPTPAEKRVDDPRAGLVRPRSADVTPGFGAWHPQDRVELGGLDDPTPIEDARTVPMIEESTTLTDAERERRLREGA